MSEIDEFISEISLKKLSAKDKRKLRLFKEKYPNFVICPVCGHPMKPIPDSINIKFEYVSKGIYRKKYQEYLCLYCKKHGGKNEK
jgi:uncharacterized protein with PIN domain